MQVLKHGNLYLLTDAFGDIHPDSRGLGLYHGDTRVVSCSVLRVGGERPVLLQTAVGGNYRGGIQMTNPRPTAIPMPRSTRWTSCVGRTVGISRERLIGAAGLEERLRVVNHAERRPSPSRSSSSSGTTGRTSSRSAADASRAGSPALHGRDRPAGSRSATTGSTGSSA